MRSHLARLVVLIAIVASAGACTPSRSDDEAGGPCDGDPLLCYPADVVVDWCHVQYVRAEVVAGRLTAADLPSWVDTTRRQDGSPQVYDFTSTDPNNWAGWSDDLRNSVRDAGKAWDRTEIDDCTDEHDVEDVVKSEGVPKS